MMHECVSDEIKLSQNTSLKCWWHLKPAQWLSVWRDSNRQKEGFSSGICFCFVLICFSRVCASYWWAILCSILGKWSLMYKICFKIIKVRRSVGLDERKFVSMTKFSDTHMVFFMLPCLFYRCLKWFVIKLFRRF